MRLGLEPEAFPCSTHSSEQDCQKNPTLSVSNGDSFFDLYQKKDGFKKTGSCIINVNQKLRMNPDHFWNIINSFVHLQRNLKNFDWVIDCNMP